MPVDAMPMETWIEPFDPFASTSFICEGTPYHYTWYAPQDIAGLIRHMGGKERFINRLDNFFEGNYYWHGNEPGHHIAYLFAMPVNLGRHKMGT